MTLVRPMKNTVESAAHSLYFQYQTLPAGLKVSFTIIIWNNTESWCQSGLCNVKSCLFGVEIGIKHPPFKPTAGWIFDTQDTFGRSIAFELAHLQPFLLIWVITWMTWHRRQQRKGVMDWTVRGSLSHIDAKSTLWKAERSSDSGNFSVNCRSSKLGFNYQLNDFSFCSALFRQYFGIWSSVYLQLLQYFILFLLPLQWRTTLVKNWKWLHEK